jgi:serine-type D-Ala-D-Ala carboxypeptidase (penicillin-binding protein 5/6)
MLEPADIAGISKIAYVLATRRCFDWRRDLQRASTNSSPPCPIDHPRRRLRLHGMSQTLQRQLGTTTRYGRRCALLVAVVALLLAATAFAAPRHLLNGADRSSPLDDKGRSSLLDDKDRAPLSTDGWPLRGQGAYVLGNGRPAVSPHQQPVPIASVAKVMTAYLVLKHHPLRAGDSGRRFVVGQRDVVDTEKRRRGGQSVVAVRAGEQLTERDALMAILLPSANNVAVLVARQVSGSVASFVAEMNRTARALKMSRTTYTDPSGYDDGTVSTALDQLRLARVVANDKTLAAMMATRSYRLPVAGEVTNTNTLLGHDGFVGMKTGSHQAAGGCLMFRAVWHTESGNRSLIGVVLGQRGGNLLAAGLYAAKQLADRLAPNAAPPERPSTPGRPGRPSAGQPGLAPPSRAYRRHIENHIRAGNTPLP